MPDLDRAPLDIARESVTTLRRVMTFPEMGVRAARLADDPDCSIRDLAELFSQDAALCTQLLKVANSAFYGLRAQVKSVQHAASLLGIRVLRNIALVGSVGGLLRRPDPHPSFSVGALWDHLVASAVASRVIATHCRLDDPEEAFAAGLLHDLGLIVMMQVDAKGFVQLLGTVANEPPGNHQVALRRCELEIYGAPHETLGEAFVESIGLPASLSRAAGGHHAGTYDDDLLSAVVRLAHVLDVGHDHGLVNRNDTDVAPAVSLACLGIDEETLEQLREPVANGVLDARAAFSP